MLERANEKFEFPVNWGIDLPSEHERYLTEKHAKTPVIVMNYPKDIKAFYLRVNDDGRTVAAMDVLAPGIGEIIGGIEREERLDVLDASVAERGIDREHYAPTLPSPASGGGKGGGICAAMARCRTRASASPRLSPGALSPTSPVFPTCATRSRSRENPETRGIDAYCLSARVSAECQGKDLARPANRANRGGITHRGGVNFPLAFGGSDKTAHDRMPVVMAQAGDAASGRVVGALQDLVGRYLDPLALGGDPIATVGIRLVVGHLAIARR